MICLERIEVVVYTSKQILSRKFQRWRERSRCDVFQESVIERIKIGITDCFCVVCRPIVNGYGICVRMSSVRARLLFVRYISDMTVLCCCDSGMTRKLFCWLDHKRNSILINMYIKRS